MRKNRRIAALLTAGLLALTPCVSAGMMFASAADDNSITITPAIAGTHNYAAYQIFKGTLSGTGAVDNPATTDVDESDPYVLSDIKWGDNAADDFLTKLKADTVFNLVEPETAGDPKTSIFADAETAEDVANVLEQYTDNSDVAIAFAKFAGNHLKDDAKGSDNTSPYQIGSLAAGYYLVEDTAPITDGENANPRTLNMLRVAGAVSMKTKEDLPTLEKRITDADGSNPTDANTAAIGDLVYYKLSSNVPELTGYDHYYYIVTDTLSSGLTFNPDSMQVKIGDDLVITEDDETIEPSENQKYYIVEETVAGGTQIKVVFENFLETVKTNNIAKDTPVTITYNATLNENASIDPDVGNPNTANLTYSNNPNFKESGTPDNKPDEPPTTPPGTDSDVVGETVEDKVNTFTTALRIKKVDQDGQPFAQGVEFTLTGTKLNKVKKVSGSTFEVDNENGTYWKLNTGSYTTVDPTTAGLSDAAKAKYANDGNKYKKVEATASVEEATSSKVKSTVDAEGYITFYGLNAGSYTLEETDYPDGYNKAETETFTISTTSLDEDAVVWASDNDKIQPNANDEFEVEIVNKKGSTLPSTGGVGTKLFYLFGGMLAVGSGVVLVTKKRMSYEK